MAKISADELKVGRTEQAQLEKRASEEKKRYLEFLDELKIIQEDFKRMETEARSKEDAVAFVTACTWYKQAVAATRETFLSQVI